MMVKLGLFAVILFLLCLSHLFAAAFGSAAEEKKGSRDEVYSHLLWVGGIALATWAVALVLIVILGWAV